MQNENDAINIINKIEQSITSMELNRNRINKLLGKEMMDLFATELKNTNDQLNSLTKVVLSTKKEEPKNVKETSYDFMSSFSDWR